MIPIHMSVFVDVRKEVRSGCYVKNSREVFDFKSLSEAVRLFLYYSLDAGGSG